MIKVKVCDCNLEYYELRSEGAPCGYGEVRECITFTCCHHTWKLHMVNCHPESDVAKRIVKLGIETDT